MNMHRFRSIVSKLQISTIAWRLAHRDRCARLRCERQAPAAKRRLRTFALAALVTVPLSPMTMADVVAPSGYASVEGNTANCYPFNCLAQHYQQVYDDSEFGSSPLEIDGIAFRGDTIYGSAAASYAATIGLSTTAMSVDGLSPTFANNLGGDAETVFSGIVTVATTADSGGPTPFSFVIAFTTPFVYDPTLGNLLLDVVTNGTTTDGYLDAVALGGDTVSRVFSSSPSATIGSDDSLGLVTQFITSQATVPEPPSLALIVLGLVGITFRRSGLRTTVGFRGMT